MKKINYIKIIPIILLVFGLVLGIFAHIKNKDPKMARADADTNVSGWAWSENYGWISFNSRDCDANDDGFFNDSVSGCPNGGEEVKLYGVDIDDVNLTGNFSGYAWSENVGWICFGGIDSSECGGVASSSAPNNPKRWAKYDWDTRAISGWAYIPSLGSDGWVKMAKDSGDSGSSYGVSLLSTSTKELGGWAWNGNTASSGVGWISFNCLDTGSCATVSYKTRADINLPPSVSNLLSPNLTFEQAAVSGAKNGISFKWTYNDDYPNQAEKYRFIIRGSDDSILYNKTCTNGGADPNNECVFFNCLVNGSECSLLYNNLMGLNYGTAYKWSVQVWDHKNSPSATTSYDTVPDTNSLANRTVVDTTFTTYAHEMPIASFDLLPEKPSQDQDTKFTSTSGYFTSGIPSGTAIACDDVNCSYQWTISTANYEIISGSLTSSTTIIKFTSAEDVSISLRVTDTDGYIATSTKSFTVKPKLPTWKETK